MITKKAKYALKALLELTASYDTKKPVLISDLAQRGRIPKKFLELILLELKNKGILESRKGKGGGYLLALPPAQIMIGPVLRIIDGPLAPLPCLSKTAYRRCDECVDEAACSIRIVLKEVHDHQIQILDTTSLERMSDKGSAVAVTYQI
ncbi:MAG: Rrf2 family transcriptional regulator [Candidatus Omnitrophica bacterium]|nr:Rrf2 family transcriptional regulator [Candidatus Omnitrophota bacterium]